MKKLCICLCAGVLLAGCSGGSKEKITKTCSFEENGMGMGMNFDAEGDTVTRAEMTVSATYEALGGTKEQFDALGEDQKKQFEEAMVEKVKQTDGTEGIDVKTAFDDEGMKVTMTYEVGALEKTLNATTVDEMVKLAEDEGMTCK